MSAGDPVLARLVGLLQAMPEADRAFVLSGLDEGECAQLRPLLAPAEDLALSPALSGLARRCEAGQAGSLTRRAAEGLLAAVRESRRGSGAEQGDPPAARETLRERLAGRFLRSRRTGA